MGTPGGMSKDLGLKLAGQSKGKKATTLFLVPTLLARVARKLPKCKALSMRRLGRKPFILIDQEAVRNETAQLVQNFQPARLRVMLARKPAKTYISLAQATANCGYKDNSRPDWLIPMAKDKVPKQARISQNRIKIASAARVSNRNGGANAPEEIFFKSDQEACEKANEG